MTMTAGLFMLFMIITSQNFYSHMMMVLWEFLISQQKITKDNKMRMMLKDARKLNKLRRLRLKEAL